MTADTSIADRKIPRVDRHVTAPHSAVRRHLAAHPSSGHVDASVSHAYLDYMTVACASPFGILPCDHRVGHLYVLVDGLAVHASVESILPVKPFILTAYSS